MNPPEKKDPLPEPTNHDGEYDLDPFWDGLEDEGGPFAAPHEDLEPDE
jgi:hypothetical protein